MFLNELVGMRERLTLLSALPPASLELAELQDAITSVEALAGVVAGLEASLVRELGERGTTTDGVEVGAWLGTALHASRREVRAVVRRGDRLAALPLTAAALASGEITADQADVVARAVTLPEDERGEAERQLLRLARRGACPTDLGMLFEQLKHRARPQDAAEAERARFAARGLTMTDTPDGSIRFTWLMDPVGGQQARDVIRGFATRQGEADDRTQAQRMADALHHICITHVDDPNAQRRRAEVIALVPLQTLLGDETSPLGRMADSHALIGSRSAQVLACTGPVRRLVLDTTAKGWDASLVGLLPARLTGPSEVLDLGRAARLASTGQHRALVVRDGGCVYPGCTAPPSMTEIHHLREWAADQGRTDLDDLALLCRWHHHHIHLSHRHLERDRMSGEITICHDEHLAAA